MITEYRFDNRDSLFATLAERCVEWLEGAIQGQQRASLLVSGGSTPAPLYRQLSQASLAWDQVDIALVDERWVDDDSEASNEKMIRQQLLQSAAAAAHFTGMKNAANTPSEGLDRCEQDYQRIGTPYSLGLLGMGADAHFASLFPHARGLSDALAPNRPQCCAAISARPSAITGEHTERISMSLSALLRAQRLVVLICGEDKWQVYQRAKDSGPIEEMPLRALLQHAEIPIDVYWAP